MDKNPIFSFLPPVEAEEPPYRNCFCPYYEECLDEAARSNFLLGCSACAYHRIEVSHFVLTIQEIKGCVALVSAVFQNMKLLPPFLLKNV